MDKFSQAVGLGVVIGISIPLLVYIAGRLGRHSGGVVRLNGHGQTAAPPPPWKYYEGLRDDEVPFVAKPGKSWIDEDVG